MTGSGIEGEFRSGLERLAGDFGLGVCGEGTELLMQHFRVLCRWNQKMNLVGDLSVDTAVYRHYGESLFLASVKFRAWKAVLDFGSGAGFPGVGLAAWQPDGYVRLAEGRQKRVAFLRESTRGWSGIEVVPGSAEQFVGDLDLIVSRAVDVGLVVGLALERAVGLRILMSAKDAEEWAARLGSKGWCCDTAQIPWKAQSVVFCASPR